MVPLGSAGMGSVLELLSRYDVTPEMLLQRLTNILPRHFGIQDLFFLRFSPPDMKKFEMTKEMHLSQLHNPTPTNWTNTIAGAGCRSTLSAGSAPSRIWKGRGAAHRRRPDFPLLGTPNAYFLHQHRQDGHNNSQNSTSVTIGLLVNDKLRQLFRFLADPKLPIKRCTYLPCERCGISDCEARAALLPFCTTTG